MTHRSLMVAAISAIGLIAWEDYSAGVALAQERAAQPVSVYVSALKGECMPDRPVMIVGGRAVVAPPNMARMTPRVAPTDGKTILTRFAEDPISRHLAEDEFRRNGAFRVVDSPMQADFVFCLCARYYEFRVPPQAQQRMRQGMNRPEAVRIGTQAVAVSVENFLKNPRDPKALNEAAFWKTDDQEAGPPDAQTIKANEKDKKRKEKKDNRANGPVLIVDSQPVELKPEVLPSDLAQRFIKRWPAFAATVAALPKPQLVAAGRGETPRPKLPLDATATVNETQPNAGPADHSTLRVETALVIVPVMAMDKDGKYMPGLTAADFEVYEDGVKQEISDFGAAETSIHVALVLDVSGSTRFKLEEIQDAALVFVDQLRPQDRVMVVSFDQQVRVEAEFTNDRDKLMCAILRTRTGGGTRVMDALDLTLIERLDNVQGRKAIVVFTDGVDTSSRLADWEDVKARVEESGVVVYPVRYDTQADVTSLFMASQSSPNAGSAGSARIVKEYEQAVQSLKNLASVSGGRHYEVATVNDAKQAFTHIAEELRRYYWLGYYPVTTARDGRYRKIRVAVGKPDVVIRARNGYRAPSGEGWR